METTMNDIIVAARLATSKANYLACAGRWTLKRDERQQVVVPAAIMGSRSIVPAR